MSITFDGTDDCIFCGTGNDVLSVTSALSIAVICTPTGSTGGNMINRRGTGSHPGIQFAINASGGLFYSVAGSAANVVNNSVTGVFALNTVNVFIVTWDGATAGTGVHFYSGGSETAYLTNSTSVGGNLNNDGILLTIGNSGLNPTAAFVGTIHEVAIFNTVISAASISSLSNSYRHNQALNVAEVSRLKRYYKLDDGTSGNAVGAGVVKDYSGNGIDGTGTQGANGSGLTYSVSDLYYPAQMAPSGFWGGK